MNKLQGTITEIETHEGLSLAALVKTNETVPEAVAG